MISTAAHRAPRRLSALQSTVVTTTQPDWFDVHRWLRDLGAGVVPNLSIGVALALAACSSETVSPEPNEPDSELVAGQVSALRVDDRLREYARACDAATGVTVPAFDCDRGTLVPVTHSSSDGGYCDRPNRLQGECDPGSRFQVLTRTADAFVVAHCRKQGREDGRYGDIAVIQYSQRDGATCFYQALANHLEADYLDGRVRAPFAGTEAYPWLTPDTIARSQFPCVKCHDNGPLLRSPYLTQLSGVNALPGAGDATFNRDSRYRFIGEEYRDWRSFKVEIEGNLCNGCHRLGVSNKADRSGTALRFGLLATAPSGVEPAKNPHSADSPIWMTPGTVEFSLDNAQAASAIQRCAARSNEAPLPASSDCRITQFTIPADGTLMRVDDDPVAVFYGGAPFRLPDEETLARLFPDAEPIAIARAALPEIRAAPIDGTLLREESGALFVVFGEARFQLPELGTYDRLYSGAPIHPLWDGALDELARVPRDGSLLREESSERVYEIKGGRKQLAPADRPDVHVLWDGALESIP
jgi:hypothetical protein